MITEPEAHTGDGEISMLREARRYPSQTWIMYGVVVHAFRVRYAMGKTATGGRVSQELSERTGQIM